MKKLLVLIALLSFGNILFAQQIAGKITDENNNETLIGVTIKVINAPSGARSNVDGEYKIMGLTPGNYTISASYLGYGIKEIENVEVKLNEVTTVNFTMAKAETKIKTVTIKGTAKKESINSMIAIQKNNASVTQVISAEQIKKSPDRNAGEVMKRVTGASIIDGKYIVIRGLGDRYNQTMVNGALMSSTEPDKKTFSYDIFNSNVIENIIINKTAIPEMPAEFSGGLTQITTREIPLINFFSMQIGSGGNTNNFKHQFASYQGGKTDFLGFDDGTRNLPSYYPKTSKNYYDSKVTNGQRTAWARDLNNIWSYENINTPINFNFNTAGGFNSKLKGKNVGALFSLMYTKNNNITYVDRYLFDKQSENEFKTTLQVADQKSSQDMLLGAMANFGIELNKNNKISFKNIFSINSSDYVTQRQGINIEENLDLRQHELGFKSNRLFSSQLLGEHFFEKAKTKFRWNINGALLNQDVPDLRRFGQQKTVGAPETEYIANVTSGSPSPTSSGRFYSNLSDKILGASFDVSKKIKNINFKTGYLFQSKNRIYDAQLLGMVQGSNASLDNIISLKKLAADKIFADENIGTSGFMLGSLTDPSYSYTAFSFLNAGFLQADHFLTKKLRAVYGVRVESYLQNLDSYDNIKKVNLNSTVTDILPSGNFTYLLNEKTNIRLAASQTVIRPEFRELAPFTFYNFDVLATERGNPKLERTKVTNIDLRYEIYPRAGELITLAGFYKNFQNPIELQLNPSGTNTFNREYINAPQAISFGAEMEFRKKLDVLNKRLENFTFFTNLAYIYNRVNLEKNEANSIAKNRPMQGQSPYIINAGLQYDMKKYETSMTLLYNQIGRRIQLIGNDYAQFPEIYEAPRSIIDFQIQKTFAKKFEFRFNVADILNSKGIFYQDIDKNGTYNASKDNLSLMYRYGTKFGIALAYKL
ncbi:MAG: carboxypeptidase-like regulatory domain-containing protein [Chitinophagaceae bacterium]|nr:carboxypeptidase-like regulatory domain-containing protein [Chitinophagaceae bacterium]